MPTSTIASSPHSLPLWLDEHFVRRLLQSKVYGPDSVLDFQLHDAQFTPLSSHATLLSSPVFRLTTRSSSRYRNAGAVLQQQFIVKVPAAGSGGDGGDDALFDAEIRFYTAAAEEMHRLLWHAAEAGAGSRVELAPRLVHYARGAEAVLVLEDLTADGFAAPARPLQLDASVSAVFKLAKWHAASICMAGEPERQTQQAVGGGIFSGAGGDRLRFICDNFAYFADDLAGTWGDAYRVYADKFAALRPLVERRGREIFAPKAGGIRVLNHGAVSRTNLLVREADAGRGVDVRLIDFQYCVWATPAIDLLCMLHLVCGAEVRETRRTELVQFYYGELRRTLDKMGYLGEAPTLQQLQIELLENGFLEVLVTVALLPFYINDDATKLVGQDLQQRRQTVYADEHFRSLVRAQLPHFLHKGYLD